MFDILKALIDLTQVVEKEGKCLGWHVSEDTGKLTVTIGPLESEDFDTVHGLQALLGSR